MGQVTPAQGVPNNTAFHTNMDIPLVEVYWKERCTSAACNTFALMCRYEPSEVPERVREAVGEISARVEADMDKVRSDAGYALPV